MRMLNHLKWFWKKLALTTDRSVRDPQIRTSYPRSRWISSASRKERAEAPEASDTGSRVLVLPGDSDRWRQTTRQPDPSKMQSLAAIGAPPMHRPLAMTRQRAIRLAAHGVCGRDMCPVFLAIGRPSRNGSKYEQLFCSHANDPQPRSREPRRD